jgi:hypothetical protein
MYALGTFHQSCFAFHLSPAERFSLKLDRSTTSSISETEEEQQQQQHYLIQAVFPCSEVPILVKKNEGVAELKRAGQGAPGEPAN